MIVSTAYRYRMALPGPDEAVIAPLKIICWRESYPGLLPREMLDGLSLDREIRQWRASLSQGIAWIAETEGLPVGFAHTRGGEVTTLYVLRDHQGAGIGRRLITHMFDEISCLGHRRAHLWVLEKNELAREFYVHLGGALVARRPCGFRAYPEIMELCYEFDVES